MRDIELAATENIKHEGRIRIDYRAYKEWTICTISYIRKGKIHIKEGFTKRRKGEADNHAKACIIALIRAVS